MDLQLLGQLKQQFPQLSYAQLLQYRQLNTGSYDDTVQKLIFFLKPSDENAAKCLTGITLDRESNVTSKGSQNHHHHDNMTGSSYRRHSEDGLATGDPREESSHSTPPHNAAGDTHLHASSRTVSQGINNKSEAQHALSDNNQVARFVPKSYNPQSSSSRSSCSESAESSSPKKAILAVSSSPVFSISQLYSNNSSASEKAVMAKIQATTAGLKTASHSRSSRTAPSNSSLPCTPSSSTSLLERLHDNSSTRYKYSNREPLPEPPPPYLDSVEHNSYDRHASTELNFCSDSKCNSRNTEKVERFRRPADTSGKNLYY